ncbi:MAG: PEGA domain-containing protein [Archangium sp.]|nr:PEGA domain-containing protein [Archangium sp.]
MLAFVCMMPRMRWVWSLVLISSVALAQTPLAPPTPRSLFDEGAALYAKGQFAAAAAKFEASFAARPVPVTKFNTARSWEQAGETLKAIDAWQAWLVMAPSAPERPQAEESLKTLGAKLARLGVQAVTITSLPLGARVSIDGVVAGLVPITVELTPTRHLVRVELDDRAPIERSITVKLDAPAVEFFELVTMDRAPAVPREAVLLPAPLPAPTVPRSTDPEFAFAMSGDTVQLHIETSDKNVRLFRLNGNLAGECRAPCDQAISRANEIFQIGGDGIVPSRAFVLIDHARGNRVNLRVKKTGSLGWFFGGGVLFTTAAVAGLAIGTVFSIQSPFEGSDSTRSLTGAVGLGIGGASLVAAILCFVLNATTIAFE